jgi:HSP20 family protein
MAQQHPYPQGAPFWDFVNSFDPSGQSNPLFAAFKEAYGPEGPESTSREGPGHQGPHGPGRRGGWGTRGRGGMRGGFGGWGGRRRSQNEDGSFIPAVDIFESASNYVIHASLPGVQKSDVGLDWNQETGTLRIAGVVHRPGDEDFLKQLTSTAERKVGVFERKVKLEKVDGEGITAKLEDGVLRIEVPKEEKDWEQVKKIDVE